MIKTIKKFLMTLSMSSLLVMPVLSPAMVAAQDDGGETENPIANNLCQGANVDGISGAINGEEGAGSCEGSGEAGTTVDRIVKLIINVFSIIVGFISVIMIIIGGLKYIMSGGDSGNITGAKNTILYAIIGLVVVALAQVIVRFVLEKAANV